MAQIKSSKDYRTFVKKKEGLRLKVYDDLGHPAIGYGSRNKKNVALGTIDENMANRMLEEDIAVAESEASKSINVENLSQGQMDTVVDIFYNVRASSRVGTVKLINEGRFDEAYQNIGKLTKGRIKGVLVDIPGLVQRSKERQEMWLRSDSADDRAQRRRLNEGTGTQLNPGIAKAKREEEVLSKSKEKGNGATGSFGKVQEIQEPQKPEEVDPLIDQTEDDFANSAVESAMLTSDPLDKPDDLVDRTENEFIDNAVDEVFQDETANNHIKEEVNRGNEDTLSGFKDAQAVSQAQGLDPDTVAKSRQLSKDIGVSSEDSLALVNDEDFKAQQHNNQLRTLSEGHPRLNKWGSKPENFQVLMTDPEGFRKLDMSQSPFMDDLEQIAGSSIYELEEAQAHIGFLTGAFDKSQALSNLSDIQRRREREPLLNHKKEIATIQKGFDDATKSFERISDSFERAQDMSAQELDEFVPAVGRVLLDGGLSTLNVLSVMGKMIMDPKATVLLMAESQKTGVLPLALQAAGAIAGGGAGFATPLPFGAAAGAIGGRTLGAGVGEAIVAFSTRLREEMQFKGFGTNYEAFYNDPIEFEKARNKALKYAGYMGAIGGVIAWVSGGIGAKALANKAPLKDVAKALGKDAAFTTAAEAGQEFAARVLPGPGVEGDPVAQAAGEALQEGLLGGPTAAASSTLGAVTRVAFGKLDDVKKTRLITKEYAKTTSAMSRKNLYDQLRENYNGLKSSRANSEQVGELVRDQVKSEGTIQEQKDKQDMEDDFELESLSDVDPDSEDLISNESALIEDHGEAITQIAGDTQVVNIRTDDWINHFVDREIDPLEVISKLGPEYVTLFANAEASGADLSIPFEKFLEVFSDDAEVGDIMRFGDEELSAKEAEENQKTIEGFLPDLFSETTEDGPDFIEAKGEPQEGDPVLRSVELLTRYRGPVEKGVHEKLTRDMKRLVKGAPLIDDSTAPLIAEAQFLHLRQRSKATGRKIEDLADQLGYKSLETITRKDGTTVLGRVTFKSPMEMVLSISKKGSTPATVIHELGHSWLYDMMFDWDHMHNLNDENMTIEQQEYRNSMQIASELLGYDQLTDLLALNPANSEEGAKAWKKAQETFAQTTESYFLNGKFKTSKIQTLMEGLRRFLRPFAATIAKAYKDFPAADITKDVERMFEGILGVTEKIEQELSPMFPEPSFDPAIFGENADKYRQAQLDARDEAIGEFVGKITKKSYNDREKLIRAALKDIQAQAKQKVSEMLSVRVVNGIRSNKDTRITTESFIEEFGQDATKSIPKGLLSGKKKKGIDVKEFMSALQLNDKDDFLAMLEEASDIKKLEDKVASTLMDEQFPTMKTDQEIHEDAVDAANSGTARRKLLRMEMRNLAKQRNDTLKKVGQTLQLAPNAQRRMLRANIESEANQIALQGSHNRYRPENFLKQSDRHSKDSVKFFGQDDLDAALESKQLQILYFEAYQKAKTVSKSLAKAKTQEKIIQKANIKKLSKNYDAKGLIHAKEVVKAFKAGKPLPTVDVSQLSRNTTVYTVPWGQYVNSIVGDINERMMKGLIPQNADASTYLAYSNLLSVLKKSARNERKVILGNRAIDRDVLRNDIIQGITLDKEGQPREPITRDDDGRGYFFYRADDLERMRESFSGMYTSGEAFAKSPLAALINNVMDNEANFTREEEAEFETIFDKFIEINKAKDKTVMQKFLVPIGKRVPFVGKKFDTVEKVQLTEFDVTVDKSELLAMILHSGSESNLRHLLLGGIKGSGPLEAYNPATDSIDTTRFFSMIDRLVDKGVITKADLEGVQAVWDILEKHYEGTNQAFEHINGFNFGKINARKLSTKLGDFTGGYFPLFQNDAYKDLGLATEGLTTNFGDKDFNELFPSSDTSFSMKRGALNELSLKLDHIPYAIHRVLQLKHLSVPLYEFGKVIGDKEVSAALESRQPGIIENVAIPWVDRTMSQRYANSTKGLRGVNVLARAARTGGRVHWFLGRISSGMKQFVGLPQALTKVPKYDLMSATVEAAYSPKETRDLIFKKSTRMNTRLNGGLKRVLRHYNDLDLNGDFIDVGNKRVNSATFYLIQLAQNQVDVSVWLGAYRDANKRNLTEEQAIGHADNTVEQTQGSSAISGRAAIEQADEVVKLLLTEFTTIPLMKYHQLLEAKRQTVDEGAMARAQAQLNIVLMTAIVPALVVEIMGAGYSAIVEGEEDEEQMLSRGFMGMAREVLDLGLPIMSGPVIDIASMALGSNREFQTSPVLGLYRHVGKGTRALWDELNSVNASSSDIESVFYMATLMTGGKIPFSPIGRGVKVMEGFKSEKLKRRDSSIRRRQLRNRKRKNK